MDLNTILRYKGCLETPPLWKGNAIEGLIQLELENNFNIEAHLNLFTNTRLGKLVEEFICYKLSENNEIQWMASNIQIQNKKITIGELDALFYNNHTPTHLEIVYKFYLYDNIISESNNLKNWIGPNRKDALIYKLDKLRKKQLPLLYNEKTKPYLDQFNTKPINFEQYVCFKAQLFLPYEFPKIDTGIINRKAVMGFYISFEKINIFNTLKFYIPKKLDWLIMPHKDVKWLNFEEAKITISTYIEQRHSPLCWLIHKNGNLEKCFITWW